MVYDPVVLAHKTIREAELAYSPDYMTGVHEMGHVLDLAGNTRAWDRVMPELMVQYQRQNPGKQPTKPEFDQWLRTQLPTPAFWEYVRPEGVERNPIAFGDPEHGGNVREPEALANAFEEAEIRGDSASDTAKMLQQILVEEAQKNQSQNGWPAPTVNPKVPKNFQQAITDIQTRYPQTNILRNVDISPDIPQEMGAVVPRWEDAGGQKRMHPDVLYDQYYVKNPRKLAPQFEQDIDLGIQPSWMRKAIRQAYKVIQAAQATLDDTTEADTIAEINRRLSQGDMDAAAEIWQESGIPLGRLSRGDEIRHWMGDDDEEEYADEAYDHIADLLDRGYYDAAGQAWQDSGIPMEDFGIRHRDMLQRWHAGDMDFEGYPENARFDDPESAIPSYLRAPNDELDWARETGGTAFGPPPEDEIQGIPADPKKKLRSPWSKHIIHYKYPNRPLPQEFSLNEYGRSYGESPLYYDFDLQGPDTSRVNSRSNYGVYQINHPRKEMKEPPVGYMQYHTEPSSYGGTPTVHVDLLETHPHYRLHGVAASLMQALAEDYPDHLIDPGSTTPHGTSFVNYMRQNAPGANERLDTSHWNPDSPNRVTPFQMQEWGVKERKSPVFASSQFLYRGMGIDHDFDPDEHPHSRIDRILDDLASISHEGGGLGSHWTTDPSIAREFAEDEGYFQGRLPVMLKVKWNGRGRNKNPPDDVLSADSLESEVPLLSGIPLHINEVHFQHPDTGSWHESRVPPGRKMVTHKKSVFARHQKTFITAREQVEMLSPWDTFAYRFADSSTDIGPTNTSPQPTGLSSATSLAQGASGKPYDYGGSGQPGRGYDCSGYVGDIYNALTGKPTGTPRDPNQGFSTTTNFADLGFKPGYNPESSFNIGVNPAPGEQGHMAGELNGVPVESSGPGGTQYGGTALGPNAPQFSQQWHLPNEMIVP